MLNLKIVVGDITKFKADAIVNCANQFLMGGGGLDGAIHRAAGKELMEECKTLGGCPVGRAKTTKGYDLLAKYIIHAVGPCYGDQSEDESNALLRSTYESVLNEAINKEGVKTLAIPAISCGIFGFPLKDAVKIAMRTVFEFRGNPEKEVNKGIGTIDKWLDEITFVVFSDTVKEIYDKELEVMSAEAKAWEKFYDNIKGLNPKRKDFKETLEIIQKYPHFATLYDDIAIKTVINNKTKYNVDYMKLLLRYGADSDISILEFPCGKVKSLYDMVKCLEDKNSKRMLKFLLEIGCKPKNQVVLSIPMTLPQNIPEFLRLKTKATTSLWERIKDKIKIVKK